MYSPGRNLCPRCRAQVPTTDASGSRSQISHWERSAKPTHGWQVLQASLLRVMTATWKPMVPFCLCGPLFLLLQLWEPPDGEAEWKGAAWTAGQRDASQSSGTGCNAAPSVQAQSHLVWEPESHPVVQYGLREKSGVVPQVTSPVTGPHREPEPEMGSQRKCCGLNWVPQTYVDVLTPGTCESVIHSVMSDSLQPHGL